MTTTAADRFQQKMFTCYPTHGADSAAASTVAVGRTSLFVLRLVSIQTLTLAAALPC